MKTSPTGNWARASVSSLLLLALPALRAADDGDPPGHCRLKREGAIPVEWKNSRLFMAGSVNGHPARMIVDTGSQAVELTADAAERFDAVLGHTDEEAVGVGGVATLYRALLREISSREPGPRGRPRHDALTSCPNRILPSRRR